MMSKGTGQTPKVPASRFNIEYVIFLFAINIFDNILTRAVPIFIRTMIAQVASVCQVDIS